MVTFSFAYHGEKKIAQKRSKCSRSRPEVRELHWNCTGHLWTREMRKWFGKCIRNAAETALKLHWKCTETTATLGDCSWSAPKWLEMHWNRCGSALKVLSYQWQLRLKLHRDRPEAALKLHRNWPEKCCEKWAALDSLCFRMAPSKWEKAQLTRTNC